MTKNNYNNETYISFLLAKKDKEWQEKCEKAKREGVELGQKVANEFWQEKIKKAIPKKMENTWESIGQELTASAVATEMATRDGWNACINEIKRNLNI